MKTNKLPKSAWPDSKEAGSQSSKASQSSRYYQKDNNGAPISYASNDSSYHYASSNDDYSYHSMKNAPAQDEYFGYKSANHGSIQTSGHINDGFSMTDEYKLSQKLSKNDPLMSKFLEDQSSSLVEESRLGVNPLSSKIPSSYQEIPERVFMNGLIKHTGIALAIIIPLAAFSAYAATPPTNNATKANVAANTMADGATVDGAMTETLSIKLEAIMHQSTNTPTTVDSVDLKKYSGTWYEIGRLPMYFQRKCAGDVTANYTEKTDGSGIIVTNKCVGDDGSEITAEGLAKPVDETGSKLKVTFLPSWIRWLPVGRADYWVLARDADYKTALVGTPDKDYLWLLARSPNISQETYAKYRQIAQQQGYDLKEFKLTPQTSQTVKLVP